MKLSRDHTEEVTPVPIPNTVVKLLRADGTAWATAWESRTSRDFKIKTRSLKKERGFLLPKTAF